MARTWLLCALYLFLIAGVAADDLTDAMHTQARDLAQGAIPGLDPPELKQNEQLRQNQGLQSVSALYTLMLQVDGNLVIFAGGVAIWSTGTGGKGPTGRFIMQDDGMLFFRRILPSVVNVCY